ncbi:MAG TPA: S9 family peptidase [Acidimicrobiia bacterium]|nr:S9 family peptidase [Acidimicrobiia bacterium]
MTVNGGKRRSGITPLDLWKLPRVGSPVIVPDGSVLVTVTTYDLEENKGRGQVWRLIEGQAPQPVTDPSLRASKPAVAPDGRIAFVAPIDDGPAQLWLTEGDGGQARPLTELPLGVLGCKWLPGGQGLIVLASLLKGHLTIEETAAELERRKSAKFTAHATEDAVYRYWDTWLVTGEVPHLFRLDITNVTLTDLIPTSTRWWAFPNTDDPIADFDVSPDGSLIAFVADSSQPPHRQLRRSLFVVGFDGQEPREITPDGVAHARRPRFNRDGTQLLFGYQELPDYYADRSRLALINLAAGSHHLLTEGWDRSAEEWEFDGRGEIVFVAEDLGRQHLFRLGAGWEEPELLARGGTLSSPAVGPDGTVYLVHHSLTAAPEIVQLAEAGQLTPVTSFTTDLKDISWGEVEDHTIPGADDEPVQFFLIRPPKGNSKPPLLHFIHGGPHGIFGDAWQWRWHAQTFAAAGYLVAMVNFHGSTSFGQDYAMSIHGGWGDKPYRDIEAVTDHLIGQGLIDEKRMAVAGGSYGGYLTAFIIGQTDRYACAVAHAPVTNLAAMYASDVTTGRQRAYGAEIWEDRARVDRYSPSSHSAGYQTPTLVIVGERDFRVPATQGLELYGVLKAKGVPARLLYFPGENHWILNPQASIYWYDQVLSWLNLHLT